MKKNLICLSVIMLNTCVTVNAGTYETPPETNAGFEFNITGFFLQPSANNLIYAVKTQPLPVPAPHWKQKYISPNYHAAFELGLKYTLPDSDNQLVVNWLHLDTSDSASVKANGTTSIAPPYYFGPLAQALRGTSANANVSFKIDNINLTFDHLFAIKNRIMLELSGGLGAASLRENINATFLGTNGQTDSDYSISTFNRSKFTGIGPRLALNASGDIWQHVALTAEVGASLLVGAMKSNTQFLSSGSANPSPVRTELADQSQTRVVPAFNGRLGLSYLLPLQAGASLSVQAGYMVTTYINGINQVVPTSLVPDAFNTGVIAIETAAQEQSSMDLNGPYLKLAYVF